MTDKFQVRILGIGKAATEIEADDARGAVLRVVEDFGRRAGEPAHMMARRLDKSAEVIGPDRIPRSLNIIECCPEPEIEVLTDFEVELADEIAKVMTLADEIADGPGDDSGPTGP